MDELTHTVAVHEAGHAVAWLDLRAGGRLDKLTIGRPTKIQMIAGLSHTDATAALAGEAEFLYGGCHADAPPRPVARIAYSLAGPLAAARFELGCLPTASAPAFLLAVRLDEVAAEGDTWQIDRALAAVHPRARRRVLNRAYARARRIVDREWPRILALGAELAARGRLDGAEVEKILASLPRDAGDARAHSAATPRGGAGAD